MKIHIGKDGRHFFVPVPLFLWKVAVGLTPSHVLLRAQENGEAEIRLTKREIQYLLKQFAAIAREYRGLEIVRVESGKEHREIISIVL